MAFKIQKTDKRRMQLISLIDVIFILLVFFLLTSFAIQLTQKEQKVYVPTPEQKVGKAAQILIQLLDDDRFFWIDKSSTKIVEAAIANVDKQFWLTEDQRSTQRTEASMEALRRNSIFSNHEIESKLNALIKKANQNPEENSFVIIRCPNEVPYVKVMNIIKLLSGTKFKNIKYGLVGGTLDEIINSKEVKIEIKTDKRGRRRESLVINF